MNTSNKRKLSSTLRCQVFQIFLKYSIFQNFLNVYGYIEIPLSFQELWRYSNHTEVKQDENMDTNIFLSVVAHLLIKPGVRSNFEWDLNITGLKN